AYYYIKNLQGDVISIFNANGNEVATYTYDAWGRTLATTDTSGVNIGAINPIRYRGYYYDTETGFYFLQTRYYVPEICRLLSSDCVIDDNGANTQNLFAYARNNPVIYKDSTGLYAETALDIVSIGLDIVDIVANPNSPLAWGALGADIAGALLPGATGLGGVVRVVATGDKLKDLAKYADKIVDFGQAIKSEKLLGTTYHSLYKPIEECLNTFLNKSIKTITNNDILSYLRPDAVDNAMEVIYELKPNNVNSIIKSSKQVLNYLNKMNKQLNVWLVVFDLYF
ncbi:MAG: hypothetical protein IKJ59_04090, partial [Clostridia bacterium]|nr:hypothetical protein [Clostridia bacterium]